VVISKDTLEGGIHYYTGFYKSHHGICFAHFDWESVKFDSPGRGIFQIVLAAIILRTWCCISSCNFGTLASFARLPMREVVVRSSSKLGEMRIVNEGVGEVEQGGIIVIWKVVIAERWWIHKC